ISSKLSKQNFNSSRFTKIGNSNDKSVKDCKQVVNIFIFGIRKFPSPTNPIILCEHSKVKFVSFDCAFKTILCSISEK
ncbi:unnamed protein product, partial [Rotaria sp. Silwood2]